jgi:hypothetical protein
MAMVIVTVMVMSAVITIIVVAIANRLSFRRGKAACGFFENRVLKPVFRI